MQRPTTVAAIPERNLFVIGAQGYLATFDAVTGVRQVQVSIPRNHTPRLIHVLPSRTEVFVVCVEWTIYLQGLKGGKSNLIMDLGSVKKKPLTDPLLTSMPASSSAGRMAVVFVAAPLKDSIRSSYVLPPAGSKGKLTKELQPGFKLSLEKGKGIIALTSHPYAPIITVLTANGELQLYQHTQGAATLTPLAQYTMLLEESAVPTPQVAGSYLSQVPCPRVPNASLILIFVPRINLFYIMIHAVGASPQPFMRIPWLGCTQVLCAEIVPPLDSLVVVAGSIVDGKYTMRAWRVLGDEGCSVDALRLQPRACSQGILQQEVVTDAAVVVTQPDWAKLWSGAAAMPVATMQGGQLDLTSTLYPERPAAVAAVVPHRATALGAGDLLVVRYMQRTPQGVTGFCPVGVFRFVDMDHPTMHHPSAKAGAVHTAPGEWRVHEVDGEPLLMLPHAVPYLADRTVRLFFPAAQDTRALEALPAKDNSGKWMTPETLSYSRRQHMAFVFCSVSQDSKRVFTPIDTAAGEDDEPKSKLFFEGVMGMFLGGDDRTFAVLESRKIGADNIAMYAVSPEMSEESLLGYTYVPLDTGDSVATLWAGPPSTVMLEEAEYDEEGGLVEREVDGGLGMALVCTVQGNLLLVQLPDVSDTPADAELLPAAVQHEMQLLDGERILQVVWTTMVPPDQVGYASHCLGAILTSQRVIMTDGQLRLLQSIATAERDATSPHAITSMLWVGPALLMTHAAGRVELALLNGKRVPVCSLARVGSYVLAGATADSLILLHRRGEQWLISTRKVLVGALLMQAWLCLLTEEHPYGTWPNVRLELQHLVKHFNVQPASDVALAEALLAAGCGDLLRPCTHFVEAAGISRCAHAAASNDWLHATEQVLQEYEVSAYAPHAPPEVSKLRQALITVSLGAMSQGKWGCAARCLHAAGETLLLMLLYALQHNRPALQQALRDSGSTSPMHTLYMLLLAADARIGLRQPLQKDWHISRPVQDKDASTWEFSENLIPGMKAAADRSIRLDVAVEPGEEGPIPALHEGGLATHLGLSHIEIIQNAQITPSIAPTGMLSKQLPMLGEEEEGDEKQPELTPEEEEQERVRQEFLRQFSGDSLFLDSTELANRDGGGDGSGIISVGGDNEDDDDDVGDLHARNIKRAQRRFNVNLKQTGDTATADDVSAAVKNISLGPPGSVPLGAAKRAAAAARGEDEPTKQDVWADLGLVKPEQSMDVEATEAMAGEAESDDPFAAFSELALPDATVPAAGVSDAAPAAGVQESSADPLAMLATEDKPPATVPESQEATASQEDPVPLGPADADKVAPSQAEKDMAARMAVNAGQAPGFLMGVHYMFAGQWQQALQSFAQAHQACSGLERLQVGQYIAVIGILQAYANVGDTEATRLSRFASAMPLLLLDHAAFLINDAVSRNMRAGNSTWCAQRLEEFVAYCIATNNHTVAQGATGRLQQVQSVGPGNSSVMKDENTATFVQRIDSASNPQDIYGIVSSLRAGLL